VGEYQSAQAGKVAITVEGNTLKFVGNNISMTIYPETDNLFFMKERDLQFEFVKEGNKIGKMVVHEKGNKVEEAKRLR
jgi:hypothetical protein